MCCQKFQNKFGLCFFGRARTPLHNLHRITPGQFKTFPLYHLVGLTSNSKDWSHFAAVHNFNDCLHPLPPRSSTSCWKSSKSSTCSGSWTGLATTTRCSFRWPLAIPARRPCTVWPSWASGSAPTRPSGECRHLLWRNSFKCAKYNAVNGVVVLSDFDGF